MTGRELHWKVGNRDVAVRIEETKDHGTFHLGDKAISFKVVEKTPQTVIFEIDGRRKTFHIVRNRDRYSVWHGGRTYHISRVNRTRLSESASSATGDITALMPGKVLRIEVAVGDLVVEKQTVGMMESMKMETALYAPRAGRVDRILCTPGEVVDMGRLLMVIADPETA